MAKKPQKKFRSMLSSHCKGGGRKAAPRATEAEMDAIEDKGAPVKVPKNHWTETVKFARPVQGGAPGLRSQTKK